ncbi:MULTISPECIES: PepSY domain-containing protein [unclassified Chitinophaga]|uniref:PepSY-associated TM helix domain-containing protein n=1 Tax=unclassified Chitinophaga TaxID=2619133 RepID=UPI00117E53FC|nr:MULTISPECIES: PepSY-associated TM helix domain-containing protein [unclassified Chitinophaga]WPV66148.1 PepSY-associated TM helix domain-containing protein [Chitinophaga sp. LS1]
MKVKQFTKLSFKVHSWLGLMLGLLYLFFGLSGSMLVFQKEIEQSWCKDLHQISVPAAGKRISLDSLYRKVLLQHPHIRRMMVRQFPERASDCYEFMLYLYQQKTTDNYLYSVFVNPYTGEIIREGNFRSFQTSFFRWLYSAHYCFQIDKPGRLMTAIISILFIISIITGFIIYRKQIIKVVTFQVKFKFGKSTSTFSSLHRIVGVWSLVFNFILFFTGFWMNKSLFLPAEWAIVPYQNKTVMIKGNLDSILENTGKVVGFTPVAMMVSADKEKDVIVSGAFSSTVNPLYKGKGSDLYFDANTNQLKLINRIEEKPFSDRFYWMLKRLHVGEFDSLLLRWMYVIIGLTPGILSLTGFYLYWKRKGNSKRYSR